MTPSNRARTVQRGLVVTCSALLSAAAAGQPCTHTITQFTQSSYNLSGHVCIGNGSGTVTFNGGLSSVTVTVTGGSITVKSPILGTGADGTWAEPDGVSGKSLTLRTVPGPLGVRNNPISIDAGIFLNGGNGYSDQSFHADSATCLDGGVFPPSSARPGGNGGSAGSFTLEAAGAIGINHSVQASGGAGANGGDGGDGGFGWSATPGGEGGDGGQAGAITVKHISAPLNAACVIGAPLDGFGGSGAHGGRGGSGLDPDGGAPGGGAGGAGTVVIDVRSLTMHPTGAARVSGGMGGAGGWGGSGLVPTCMECGADIFGPYAGVIGMLGYPGESGAPGGTISINSGTTSLGGLLSANGGNGGPGGLPGPSGVVIATGCPMGAVDCPDSYTFMQGQQAPVSGSGGGGGTITVNATTLSFTAPALIEGLGGYGVEGMQGGPAGGCCQNSVAFCADGGQGGIGGSGGPGGSAALNYTSGGVDPAQVVLCGGDGADGGDGGLRGGPGGDGGGAGGPGVLSINGAKVGSAPCSPATGSRGDDAGPTCPIFCGDSGSGATDCNRDGVLTIADFACFERLFQRGSAHADCDRDRRLTVADYGCFQARFVSQWR